MSSLKAWRLLLALVCLIPTAGSPQDYFPVGDGNAWIYEIDLGALRGSSVRSLDTLTYEMEVRVRDGRRHVSRPPSVLMLGVGDSFEVDESGNLWARIQADSIPSFEEVPLYKGSAALDTLAWYRELAVRDGTILLYDFDGRLSALSGLATGLSPAGRLIAKYQALSVWGRVWRSRQAAADGVIRYEFEDPSSYAGVAEFQRAIGIVRGTYSCTVCGDGASGVYRLLWARVDGQEYGAHPGSGFPGYGSAVEAQSWGAVKREHGVADTSEPPASVSRRR